MQIVLAIIVTAFIAGLGFAPAKDLPDKVKQAAQFATIVAALFFVVKLIIARTEG